MTAGEPAIEVRGLAKRFRVYQRRHQTLKETLFRGGRGQYEVFWAIRELDLQVPAGTTVGIIGTNGSGKSTLLKCVAGILQPDRGRVRTRGRMAALLELGAGFHPEYSGRENVYLNGAILGLPRSYINRVFDEIVEFSELERFIDNPVKTYSSGMYARLGFSVAVHVAPDVLLLDEVLSVGDAHFQKRAYARMHRMHAERRTMLVVSHNLEAVRELCHECIWLDAGTVAMRGRPAQVIEGYLAHSRALDAARPSAG